MFSLLNKKKPGKKSIELEKKRPNCSKTKSKKARKRTEKGSVGQEGEESQENTTQNVVGSRNGSADRAEEEEEDCRDETEMAKLSNGTPRIA
eukprot:g24939.t1